MKGKVTLKIHGTYILQKDNFIISIPNISQKKYILCLINSVPKTSSPLSKRGYAHNLKSKKINS